MGKQKQQVISRFFAPKPKAPSSSSSSIPSSPSPSPSPSSLPNPPTPPPKISTTVTFSPSKRLPSSHVSPSTKPPKAPKISHPIDPSLHQKFVQKLLQPSSSTPTKLPLPTTKYTPLEQQVVDLKQKYPDVLLMVEVGYRYRFFGEDAEIAARVLGIYAHVDHNFLTASIPTFRLNVHVRRLVSAGFKVGVVKQTETAAIKAHGSNKLGPFCRGLSALYTKATLEAAEDVGGGEEECGSYNNYLVCVVEKGISVENSKDCGVGGGFDVRIGIVAVEVSTGDVVHGKFNDNFMRAGLEAVILSMSPAELLLGYPLSKQTEKLLLAYAGPASNVRVERTSRDCFSDGGALAEVMSLYENLSENSRADHQVDNTEVMEQENHCLAIEGIMSMPDLAVQALALTIRHLKQFGLERILCMGASFRPFSSNMEMTLSANALQQLEVLNNHSDGSESGSLLHTMNHTLTIFGSRLLRHWVSHPLCDSNMISARLDAVSEIVMSMGSCKASQNFGGIDEGDSDVTYVQPEVNYLLSSVLTTLGRSPDIQRGLTRIFHRTATASEFISVTQAILFAGKQLQRLHIEEKDVDEKGQSRSVRSVLLRKLILTASSSGIIGNAAKLLSTLNKEAADKGDLPNLFIISSGQFPELPVDVKVPSNWVKVNSTKKTVRYHPPEVLSALDQLSLANEELMIACRGAWDSFLRAFDKYFSEFQAAVQALATLDCLHSLAILSRNKNYVRPVFVGDSEPVQMHICSGRHPVLETVLQDNFVPNDTNLHADGEYCEIVTGPNMGGKSCYIRQVALIAIMAQVGSFVPASSAKLCVLDGIHTRMGSSDSIQQGRSTFLEELSEASHIIHNCTSRSLVIIDELGRGTSTHDGVAIAYATLHYLLEHKRCMVLFVTHYPKIVDVKNEFPGSVGAYHVSYMMSQRAMDMDTDTDKTDSKSDKNAQTMDHEDVTYLYKLVPGVSERSFGFKVAQLAQLPSSCIRRANVMAAELEAMIVSRVKNSSAQKTLQGSQQSISIQSGCSRAEQIGLEEDACREFFLDLKSALGNADPERSLQFLKHARSIAKELIGR
ncbi:DNA mismatch repair protein MSH3 isoform X2 [Vitis vinifera]|uniref:DNA mismatch repair protein MSH3 isoform X2 n=1 Tax=Vitis vinifera TaxID=29760 RepID=UPI0028832791|nr:DNA mismatch repair protein MSH3 isoform X2 [Vitis vinifera]